MSDTNKNERDNDDDDDYREWSSLPDDIWSMLREHLASFPLDVLRFRSVCSFFRSLFPPPSSASFPSSPLVLPRFSFPIPPFPSPIDAFVSPTTLYRLDRPFQNDNQGWLIKVQHPLPQEDGGRGKFRLLDPLSCRRINDLTSNGGGDGGGFYLNDFRLTELSTSYALRFIRDSSSIPGISKLIIYSNSSFSSVFLINDNGKLGFAKNGDNDITVINNKILDFNDIILHQNQPYVVDRWGTLSRIDESLNLIDYSQPLFGQLGHHKHLITGEHLFIVDRYLDESNDAKYPLESGLNNFNTMHQQRRHGYSRPKTASFKVYKLDEECGKWVEVRCLGEKAFVLSHNCCFAVRAKEFVGFRENCIYFTEQFETFVFSLEEGNIENLPCTPGYSQLF